MEKAGGEKAEWDQLRDTHKLWGFRPGHRKVLPHHILIAYVLAASHKQQRCGQGVQLEVIGAAALGGPSTCALIILRPPSLFLHR